MIDKKLDLPTLRKELDMLSKLVAYQTNNIAELFDTVTLLTNRIQDVEADMSQFKQSVKASLDHILQMSESTNKSILEKLNG